MSRRLRSLALIALLTLLAFAGAAAPAHLRASSVQQSAIAGPSYVFQYNSETYEVPTPICNNVPSAPICPETQVHWTVSQMQPLTGENQLVFENWEREGNSTSFDWPYAGDFTLQAEVYYPNRSTKVASYNTTITVEAQPDDTTPGTNPRRPIFLSPTLANSSITASGSLDMYGQSIFYSFQTAGSMKANLSTTNNYTQWVTCGEADTGCPQADVQGDIMLTGGYHTLQVYAYGPGQNLNFPQNFELKFTPITGSFLMNGGPHASITLMNPPVSSGQQNYLVNCDSCGWWDFGILDDGNGHVKRFSRDASKPNSYSEVVSIDQPLPTTGKVMPSVTYWKSNLGLGAAETPLGRDQFMIQGYGSTAINIQRADSINNRPASVTRVGSSLTFSMPLFDVSAGKLSSISPQACSGAGYRQDFILDGNGWHSETQMGTTLISSDEVFTRTLQLTRPGSYSVTFEWWTECFPGAEPTLSYFGTSTYNWDGSEPVSDSRLFLPLVQR